MAWAPLSLGFGVLDWKFRALCKALTHVLHLSRTRTGGLGHRVDPKETQEATALAWRHGDCPPCDWAGALALRVATE